MSDNIFELDTPPCFPPLFHGQEVDAAIDPFDKARAQATLGCDSGLIVYSITPDMLRAAIVFAPEEPLESAMAALCACGLGFQNALGALAPPEVAVHLTWPGAIRVNAAHCGQLRAAASTASPSAIPDWLVVGVELRLSPANDHDPGLTPEQTTLAQEGCGAVSPQRLLESWSRHALVWINRLEDSAGRKALHQEWRALIEEIGKPSTVKWRNQTYSGTFLGVDENFGMLLRDGETSHLIPLTSRLENGEAP